MDTSTFNRAKAAYDAQDWETAAILFSACMEGPGGGEAAHLRGNALMRLGRVQEANRDERDHVLVCQRVNHPTPVATGRHQPAVAKQP